MDQNRLLAFGCRDGSTTLLLGVSSVCGAEGIDCGFSAGKAINHIYGLALDDGGETSCGK